MQVLKAALTNYKGVQGANFCWGPWTNPGTNCNDCEPWFHDDGMLYPMVREHPKRFADVLDGSSNTLMIGEDIWNKQTPGPNRYGQGYGWAHAVEACRTAAIPPNLKQPGRHPGDRVGIATPLQKPPPRRRAIRVRGWLGELHSGQCAAGIVSGAGDDLGW